MEVAIKIEQLCKKYSYKKEGNTVLNNLSLTIYKGEIIGVTGANGSGKTTLFRTLAGLTQPTNGSIQINGKLGAVLELGAVFNNELTGYENILYYAQILGYRKQAILPLIQQIIDFSEIEHYINEPVKTYSKGMFLRLAFSIVVHVDFDIYLFDEVFAVGDLYFKSKCIDKLFRMKSEGKTIVLTGHDPELIALVCNKVVKLENGNLVEQTSVERDYFSTFINDEALEVSNVSFQEVQSNYHFSCKVDNAIGYERIDLCLMFEYANKNGQRFFIHSFNEVSNLSSTNSTVFHMYIPMSSFVYSDFSLTIYIIKNQKEVVKRIGNINHFTKNKVSQQSKILDMLANHIQLHGVWKKEQIQMNDV